MAKKRRQIDWEAIEREYRAGTLTVREIATQYDCHHTSILKQAKKHGWDRDLTEKVMQKVTAKVTKKVTTTGATEKEIVEAASDRIVGVIELHRKDISKQREIANSFLEELESNQEELSLKERSEILQKINQAASKYIPLERQAYNIDDRKDGGRQIDTPGITILIETLRKLGGKDYADSVTKKLIDDSKP